MTSRQPEKENSDFDITDIGSKKGRKKTVVIVGVIVLLIISGFIVLKVLHGNKTAAVNGNFTTYEVERRDITVTLSGSGTLKPADSYTIKSLVGGDIIDAPFEEGQVVKKGTALYKVDSSDENTSIAKAEDSLAQSQNVYQQKLKSLDDLNIKSTADGTVTELDVDIGDKVNAGQTIATVRDTSVMKITLPFASGYAANFYVSQSASVLLNDSGETLNGKISKVDSEDKVTAGNAITRDVTIDVVNPGALSDSQAASAIIDGIQSSDSGTFAYKDAKTIIADVSGTVSDIKAKEGDRIEKNQVIAALANDSANADVENAAISVKDAELSLQSSKNQLDNYTITSPIAGTIVEKDYKQGDTLEAGETLCTVFDLSYLKLVLNVDELDIGKVKTGQTVKITASDPEGTEYSGTVMKININGTTVNGVTSYPVTIRIDHPGDLLPGMNVDAKIEVESLKNVLSIPVGLVARNGQVLVKTGEAASSTIKTGSKIPAGYTYKKVNLGGSNDDYIEVVDGLKEGDIVAEIKEASASPQIFGGPRGRAGGSPTQDSAPAQGSVPAQGSAPAQGNGGAAN